MAGFGDPNDISVNLTLNAEDAFKALKDLAAEIKKSLGSVNKQFKDIADGSKELIKLSIEKQKVDNEANRIRQKQIAEEGRLQLAKDKLDLEMMRQISAEQAQAHKQEMQRIALEAKIKKQGNDDDLRLLKIYAKESEAASKVRVASIKAEGELRKTEATQIAQALKQEAQLAGQLALSKLEKEKQQITAGLQLAKTASTERIALDNNVTQVKIANIKKTEAAVTAAAQTERARVNESVAQLQQQAALIKQQTVLANRTKAGPSAITETPEQVSKLSQALDLLKNSFIAVGKSGVSFGVNVATITTALGALGPAGVAAAAALATLYALKDGAEAFAKFREQIVALGKEAGELEGLRTGFVTLQRTLGQDPAKSLEALREATKGLISDTQLYQRANQAVLLGVPTEIFNEAAAAAVKLGRAMGIDAAFGLESLSLGLGRQSRLYLDNLGIVVSAEEAYKKFAESVGKSANDLTDAEKRAAFFAEALKKIKERAEELPEPLDNVGIATQKLQVSQQNVNTAYLDGFNTSQSLTEALKTQSEIVKSSSDAAFVYGRVWAFTSAQLIKLQNVVLGVSNAIKNELARALDQLIKFKPETQIKAVNDRIERLNSLIDFTQKQVAQGFLPTESLDTLKEKLKAAEDELEKLQGQLVKATSTPFIIAVQTKITSIADVQEQLQAVFAGVRKEAEQAAGVFRVGGLSDQQVKDLFGKISEAKTELDKNLEDPTAINKFNQSLQSIEKSLIGLNLTNAKENIKDFLKESRSIGGITKNLANLPQFAKGLATAFKAGSVSVEELKDGLNAYLRLQDKATKSAIKDGKQLESEAKKRERAIKAFLDRINRITENAIPPEFEERVDSLFQNAAPDSKEFADGLKDIADAALKSEVNLANVADYIKDIQDESTRAQAEITKLNEKLREQGVPEDALPFGIQAKQDAIEYNAELEKIQSRFINIRDIFKGKEFDLITGKKKGGGFFGYDIGEANKEANKAAGEAAGEAAGTASASIEAEIAQQIADAIRRALDLAFTKGAFSRENAAQLGQEIGGAIGQAVYGTIGRIIGEVLGRVIGEVIARSTNDLKSTKARKELDEAFQTLFEGDRIAIIVQEKVGEGVNKGLAGIKDRVEFISVDFTFEGFTRFAEQVRFGGENFRNYFNTLSTETQAAFNGVGAAIGQMLGIAEEQAKLIGVALANNIGGSLQNLQLLIYQTTKSVEDFGNALVKAFLMGKVSLDAFIKGYKQLQQINEKGIPGLVGAWKDAVKNFTTALREENPGIALTDSLRDWAVEADEAGMSFEQAVYAFGESMGWTAQQTEAYLELLKRNGITNLEELGNASDVVLAGIAFGIKQINDGVVKTKEDLAKIPVLKPIESEAKKPTPMPTTPRGGGGKSSQEIARDLLKQQREEAVGLLKSSTDYLAIIKKLNEQQLKAKDAGTAIRKLNQQILDAVIKRDKLEKSINAELDKGTKANVKRLAQNTQELAKIEEFLKKISETTEKSGRAFKEMDLKAVIPLLQSLNQLGVVSKQVGVELDTNVAILVKGFLQGRLSIQQVNDEIKKTKDLLGPGIPKAVGAVTDAFSELVNAGTKGGAFSVDAFLDIFAEFREKFKTESSALREETRKRLVQNVDTARAALGAALTPDLYAAAKKTVDAAEKALSDFRTSVAAPSLSDLRELLKGAFDPAQVEIFFRALDESGIASFDGFEAASQEAIIGILGRLSELGFQFNESADNVNNINTALQEAEKNANAGLDPLAKAIELVTQFNSGAETLPPTFDATKAAIEGAGGAVAQLKTGFEEALTLLAKLSGKIETDVVFNVRAVGVDTEAEGLINTLFGDGTDTSISIGSGGSSGDVGVDRAAIEAQIQRKERRRAFLKSSGRANSDEYKRLGSEIRALKAKLDGR